MNSTRWTGASSQRASQTLRRLSDQPSHEGLANKSIVFAALLATVGGTWAQTVTDNDTPTRNAVVKLTVGSRQCTGTLVARDVVLTAAHCIVKAGSDQVDPALVPTDGHWHALPAFPAVSIRVGIDPADPILLVTRASHINIAGPNDDVALLAIAPILPSTAVPRQIAFNEPAGISSTSTLTHSRYGQSNQRRALGYSTRYRHFMSLADPAQADNYFCFDDVIGELMGAAEGGPVLWNGPDGAVIGVYQGSTRCNHRDEHPSAPLTDDGDGAVMTFGTGNTFNTRADVRFWLQRYTLRSFCSRTAPMALIRGGLAYARLEHWSSVSRDDHFTTTQPEWRGCYVNADREIQHDGYTYKRLEGWLRAPAGSTPPGMIPVYLWWNESTKDNATSTDAFAITGAGWVRSLDVLGYAYVSPTARAGLIPLRLWYSASRKDYLTTTDSVDYSTLGYARVGPGIGGAGPGVIAFVPRPDGL